MSIMSIMIPLYEERGGGRIGNSYLFAWHASWPLSKIYVLDDRIILKVWPWTQTVFFYDIDEIEQKMSRIIIRHHGRAKKYLSFSAFDIQPLANKLRELGVKVVRQK